MVEYNIIKNLGDLFNCSICSIFETYTVFETSFTCHKCDLPPYFDICEVFKGISSNDVAKFDFSIPDEIVVIYDNTNELDYSNFLDSIDDDIQIDILFTVNKDTSNNQISIYNFSKFSELILNDNLLDVIESFNNILSGKPFVVFFIFDRSNFALSTSTLFFTTVDNLQPEPDVNRQERICVFRSICNYQNGNNCELIPEDFHFSITTPENEFKNLFQRIETFLSMIYLSSNSYLDNKKHLQLQLSGHLVKNFKYSLDAIEYNMELYDIYKWVYTDGNPVDKVILARNIISLHCRSGDFLSIDEKTFLSIKSNYALYLRDNVQHYMKVKLEFAEYVSNLTIKFGDLFFRLLDRFKNNLIAFFTFMIAVFFANIVQNPSEKIIFTSEVKLITYFILFGSFLYLLISLLEMHCQMENIKKGYNTLKNESDKILDQSDVEKIFKNDVDMNNSIKKLKINGIILAIFWGILIIICYIGVAFFT